MKKFLKGLAITIVAVVAVGYLFRAPLMGFVADQLTADMFLPEDPDDYSPGIGVGQQFPPLNTLYQGAPLMDPREFVRDKGMIFIANRSVDW